MDRWLGLSVLTLVMITTAGIAVAQNDSFEPNDNFDEATSITDGHYPNLQNTDGDNDVYAVHLEAGQQIATEIEFDHDDADLELSLYDPNHDVIIRSSSNDDNERITRTVSHTETYYVGVDNHAVGRAAEYDMTIATRFEPNDRILTAQPIEDGVYHNLAIVDGEPDAFAVDLEVGQEITAEIDFDHDVGDLDLVVLDPDENRLDASLSTDDGEWVNATANQSGTHYVAPSGWGSVSNEYDLGIASRFESNDAITEAASIDPGDYEHLAILDGEYDYSAVDLEAGQEITAEIDFDHDHGNLDLALLDSDEDEIDASTSTSDDERVAGTAADAGTYYVVAHGALGASNEYEMSIDASETPTPNPTPTPVAGQAGGTTATDTGGNLPGDGGTATANGDGSDGDDSDTSDGADGDDGQDDGTADDEPASGGGGGGSTLLLGLGFLIAIGVGAGATYVVTQSED